MRAVACRREGSRDSPHYQVHVVDDAGTDYRIAVNVLSQLAPSELLYLVDDDCPHPVTRGCSRPRPAGTARPRARRANLDYIRGNLFDPAQMRPLPPTSRVPTTTSPTCSTTASARAIAESGARLYAFGERWGPEAASRTRCSVSVPATACTTST